MAVASELSCLLNALDEPAMLIRPEDMTVAAANAAFLYAFGALRLEGRRCWEALHRSAACGQCGLGCPLKEALRTRREARVEQILFAGAGATRFRVSVRPVLAADGRVVYWLERVRPELGLATASLTRGQVGVSAAHEKLMREIGKAAAANHPLLIVGERGLGKELYARTVHENSVRASRPFVAVPAAAASPANARMLLCGCAAKRGRAARTGLMERAAGGTLFIGHVEKLPVAVQQMLADVLSCGLYEPLDALVPAVASFRLMASSAYTMADLCASGRLQPRLARFFEHHVLEVAPLRERREDIAPLARHFVRMLAPANSYAITEEAVERLTQLPWPGNARQLRETLEEAALHAVGTTISAADIVSSAPAAAPLFHPQAVPVTLSELPVRYINWLKETFSGSRAEMARMLGVSERTLYRLLAQAEGADAKEEAEAGAAAPISRIKTNKNERGKAGKSPQGVRA